MFNILHLYRVQQIYKVKIFNILHLYRVQHMCKLNMFNILHFYRVHFVHFMRLTDFDKKKYTLFLYYSN